MADRKKGKQAQSIELRMALLADRLSQIGQKDPAAYDRRFRTPIRFLDDLNNSGIIGETVTTPHEPSNSRINFPTNNQSFRGPDAFSEYTNKYAEPLKHELIHVLQNIDKDPFAAASNKIGNYNGFRTPGYDALHGMYPGYGWGSAEKEAYLLSRTGRLNPVINNRNSMNSPEFYNPPTLIDKLLPLRPNNGLFRNGARNYRLEQGRSEYLNELPEGLRNIIESISGKGTF